MVRVLPKRGETRCLAPRERTSRADSFRPWCALTGPREDLACRTTVLRGDGEESVMQSFLSCQDTLLRTPAGPPTQAVTEGTVLAGRFELRRFIARGGMGVVFEAEDRMLRARVAVKVLLGPVPDAEERIRREVLLARA